MAIDMADPASIGARPMSADASTPFPTEGPRTPEDHPEIKRRRVGVLLVNLGTPDAPEAGPVRRYLKEFLSDKRVVDYPDLVWGPLLHGVILNTRPAKTANAYKSIWMDEEG